ncbi:GlpG protein [Azomonas agilis]|uniref:GlpG protein n=1 Tax=Azomonas agilis TaxID=116849 RepID=A0A562I2N0_9GAMM|nr:rhomboid family intramembrane serine protease [Azomonas agilis]TWH65056.1 GlpG protein [Azomonas agilis]
MNVTLCEALRRPTIEDLSGFLALLRQLHIPCRIYEEGEYQVLVVPVEQVAEVQDLYRRYPQGHVLAVQAEAAAQIDHMGSETRRLSHRLGFSRVPVTWVILSITALVALFTALGDNLETIRHLSFLDFRIRGDYGYFSTLEQMLGTGQYWRLITPIFVHFGILHLAMNSLWFWELGRRIELHQGSILLAVLVLLFGLTSNLAQYFYGGPGVFGGLSGVLYGLLGHCWLHQRLAPTEAYQLPQGVVGLMLIWLLVCLSGLVETLSFGAMSIANAAHVAGLLIGCATGTLSGYYARTQHSRAE